MVVVVVVRCYNRVYVVCVAVCVCVDVYVCGLPFSCMEVSYMF